METPSWVAPVVRTVAMNNHRITEPKIRFFKRNRTGTSGRYHGKDHSITICAGTDEKRHLYVLLHELAHWLMRSSKGHTKRFWKIAIGLYDDFGVTELAMKSEIRYRKTAQRVYEAT